MQKKMFKVGFLVVESVNRFLSILVLSICLTLPTQSFSQNKPSILLQDALLDLAKIEKKSIVFSSSNIPTKSVLPLSNSMPLKDRISHLLKGTDIFFQVENGQIFLYKKHKLYGYIEDGFSGERLISSLIYLPSSGEYEVTNDFGYFSISTQLDSLELEVSYIGYATKRLVFSASELDKSTIISLKPDNSFSEVLITDNLVSQDERRYIELDKGSDILLMSNQAVSALGGEPDLFQAMIRQSGVSSGTDGIGGIHVRGGKNDQNLILYDGVKLYNSAHAFGMFSIVNSSVIDQTRMHKSGASGSTFGRLASVLNIKTKDPNLLESKGNIQFSSLAGQASLEVPLVKNRLAIMATGRHTYVDPYVKYIAESNNDQFFGDGSSDYKFYDGNIKMYGKINNTNKLYLTLYQGNDDYEESYKDDFIDDNNERYYFDRDIKYNWKNRFGSLRWNSLIGNNSFMNIQFSAYEYDYRNKFESNLFDGEFGNTESFSRYVGYNAQTTNYEIKLDLETVLKSHHLKYGFNASQKYYQIGELIDTTNESTLGNFNQIDIFNIVPDTLLGYSNKEITVYLSDKMKISDAWILEAGIYQVLHATDDGLKDIPDPIFGTYGYIKSLNKIKNNLYLGASIGTYVQTEHLLTLGDNGYPNDIWVPSTNVIPFQRSYQFEVFSELDYKKHKINASAYLKKQDGILRYADYASLPGLTDVLPQEWEFEVNVGEALGYGFELDYTYKNEDKISIHGVYSYGVTNYEFEEINGGFPFLFDYSIPHTFSLGCNLKLNDHFRLVVDWFASSGKPFTLYESEIPYSPFEIDGNLTVYQLSNENDFRLPSVHKLSLMLSTKWSWSGTKNNLSLGVQNLYNRRNVILQYELAEEGLTSQRGFPILPMFLWRISL